MEVAALQEKVASLEEECQDRCRMANEWYDALKVGVAIIIITFLMIERNWIKKKLAIMMCTILYDTITTHNSVFSPAYMYLKDKGPLSLQCLFVFYVGLGWSQNL